MVFARQSYPQLKKSLSSLGFNPLDVGAGTIPSPTTVPTTPTEEVEQPDPIQPEGESRIPEVPTDDENRRRVEFSVGDFSFKDFNPFDIFSSEDLIRSAKISNSPVAKFGPTVLGLLGGPVVGAIARGTSFLINREVEKVLDLRDINNEGLKDQWKKGNTEERQAIINKLETSSKQAREATKPVEIFVDPTVDRPAGVQQPTTITPQEAAAAAVTGSQNLSLNVIPDVPDFDVGDVEGAEAAAGSFGISFNKDGGEIRQPLVIGGVASQVGKGASKLLTRLQRETPKKLVAKDPTSINKQMSELSTPTKPETLVDPDTSLYVPTKTQDAYKLFIKGEDNELYPLFVEADKPVKQGEWLSAKFPDVAFKGKTLRGGEEKLYVPSKGAKRVSEKEKGTGDEIVISTLEDAEKLKEAGFSVSKFNEKFPFGKVRAVRARPGWHGGKVPVATHLGPEDYTVTKTEWNLLKKEYGGKQLGIPNEAFKTRTYKNKTNYIIKRRAEDQVWAKVEMGDDYDWQEYLRNQDKTELNDRLPLQGSYSYVDGRASKDPSKEWRIGGDMKIIKVLSPEEAEGTRKIYKVQDLPTKKRIEFLLKRAKDKKEIASETRREQIEIQGGYLSDKFNKNQIVDFIEQHINDNDYWEFDGRGGIAVYTYIKEGDKFRKKTFKIGTTTLGSLRNWAGYSEGGQVQDLRDGGRVVPMRQGGVLPPQPEDTNEVYQGVDDYIVAEMIEGN